MTNQNSKLIHPLKPIYDCNSEILILGSFPSVLSREKNFYYANPTNRFWKVIAEIFSTEIKDREQFCLDHHIALWDVIYSCTIHGSSDSSIRDVQANDIQKLVQKTKIHSIYTTGGKASKLYDQYIQCDIPHYSLPSTSAANARMRFDELCENYRVIVGDIYEKED